MEPLEPRHATSPADVGAEQGFGAEASDAMWRALVAGRGTMAQFSHPEFGGSGQWMQGGMMMIGDMFNRPLAARVDALATALADLYRREEAVSPSALAGGKPGTPAKEPWWGAQRGDPSTSGAQNGIRYACFPESRRLVIERDGSVETYDTADHLIGGVSQQQGSTRDLSFASQHGPVDLAKLRRIDATAADARSAQVVRDVPTGDTHQVLTILERLADLHGRGVLTDTEFADKKSELLARL